jgi:hypothetical protein
MANIRKIEDAGLLELVFDIDAAQLANHTN